MREMLAARPGTSELLWDMACQQYMPVEIWSQHPSLRWLMSIFVSPAHAASDVMCDHTESGREVVFLRGVVLLLLP